MNDNIIVDAKIDVELLSPKPGDYMVFYIDVGKMPPARGKEYMDRVVSSVSDDIMSDGVKKIFLARSADTGRRGSEVTTMSIEKLKDEIAGLTEIRDKYDPV